MPSRVVKTEQDLYAAILLEYSHGSTRLFRTNAGIAYQGTVVERSHDYLALSPWRLVRLGIQGISDLTGWTAPGETAIYTAIECKLGKRQPTAEQSAFLEIVRRCGGRAGVARSVEEAGNIINGVNR